MSARLPSDAAGPAADVELVLPSALAGAADGRRSLLLRPAGSCGPLEDPTVADVLELLRTEYPGVYRRVCDETGVLRRYVNLYVDGEDIRSMDGMSTVLSDRAELLVLQSIAGG